MFILISSMQMTRRNLNWTGQVTKLKRRMQRAIATKLFVWIFSIYLLVALITTVFYLFAEFSHARKSITNEIKAISDSLSPGIARAIWIASMEQLEAQVESIPNIPFIVGVTVETDWFEKMSYGRTPEQKLSPRNSGNGLVSTFQPLSFV